MQKGAKMSAPFETIKQRKTAREPSFLMKVLCKNSKMLDICGFLLYQFSESDENCRIGFDTICFVIRLETI